MADFNGDGKPDLAVSNFNFPFNVSVLLNTTPPGASTPSFADQHGFGDFTEPAGVAVADINGDGRPDLAVTDEYSFGEVWVLLNTTAPGASTPSFADQVGFLAGQAPRSLAFGDFNGDGRPDLVVATNGRYGGTTVSVLLNTTAPGADTPSFADPQTFATGNQPIGVAVADFNGDSKPDLAVTNLGDNTVSVLLDTTATGASTASFADQQTFATGSRPGSPAVGDFNGDGKPDLAVINFGDNTVSALLNTTAPGASTASFADQQTFATGSRPEEEAAGDFNGDGRPDLAVTNFGDKTVSVLLNTTLPGASTPGFRKQKPFATADFPEAVAVGEFNGDGRLDLAVANISANTVSVLLNTQVPITIALNGNPATGSIQDDDAPVSMAIVAGNNQSAAVNTAFATNLLVEVRNAAGNLVQGVTVTFIAPASGPSGTFSTKFGGSSSVMFVTDASGRARAPTFTANALAGSYTVVAQATGGSSPSETFNLSNTTVAALSASSTVVIDYAGTIHFTSPDQNNAAFDLTWLAKGGASVGASLTDMVNGKTVILPGGALMSRHHAAKIHGNLIHVTELALDEENKDIPGGAPE